MFIEDANNRVSWPVQIARDNLTFYLFFIQHTLDMRAFLMERKPRLLDETLACIGDMHHWTQRRRCQDADSRAQGAWIRLERQLHKRAIAFKIGVCNFVRVQETCERARCRRWNRGKVAELGTSRRSGSRKMPNLKGSGPDCAEDCEWLEAAGLLRRRRRRI
jgi:hypothetical protein